MFRLIIMGGPADLFKNAWFTLTTQFLETVFRCLVVSQRTNDRV